jgi:long-chain acyl-CoA synthetase
MTTCMTPAALGPGTMILVADPRDVTEILKTIHKQRPQMYPGVPALYVAIINHPDVSHYDLSCLESCISGAAPLPLEVQARFQELTGARLVEGYGLSEASPITHSNPVYGENRIGTIGLPWPDTEAKIVDTATGERLLDVGQPGEICVRGPQVMKGYWRMPTETANVLRPDPDGGRPWLHTGDIGLMDEDGYFRVVDRLKDMILGTGGFNVYPREIEEVLFEHPQIREAAVIGVTVEGKGQRIKAYVVLKAGQSASEEQIIEFCRQNLAPYKVPKFVEFRDELPKSEVGKVLRRELNKRPAKS